jgi:hypothetical protein
MENNPTDYTPYALGAGGLSMLLNALFGGGMSPLEKEQLAGAKQKRGFRAQLFPQLQGMMRNPGAFQTDIQRATQPGINRMAGALAPGLGTDSGAFAGALGKYAVDQSGNQWLNMKQQLLSLLTSLGG